MEKLGGMGVSEAIAVHSQAVMGASLYLRVT